MSQISNDVGVGTRILYQLGGGRFTLFTGCSNYVALENGLQFKVGRNGNKITHCKITLTDKDEYCIEYKYIKGSNLRTLKTVLVQDRVQAEDLTRSFFEATGMSYTIISH